MVKYSCTGCYGIFTISSVFLKLEEDHPKFCPFCGKEEKIVQGG